METEQLYILHCKTEILLIEIALYADPLILVTGYSAEN